MKKLLPLLLIALTSGCATDGPDMSYRPTPQILPANIQRIALRQVVNKTQQFGLEDKLLLRVRDEFLRDGRYPLLPEASADGVVHITITRYILTPIQYDSNLIPTAYKLRILVDLTFVDRSKNAALWEEPNLEGVLTFPALTLPGGRSEEQAREQIWDVLARDIVTRVVQGFGSVTGQSQRRITSDAPSTAPNVQPEQKLKPVNNNTY